MKPTTRIEKKANHCGCPTCRSNFKDYKKLINRAKRRKQKQELLK